MIIFLCILIYLIAGGLLPYLRQPQVSQEFKDDFQTEDFYSDEISCDRAAILEDNGDALRERIRLIANAKKSICMSTFDFRGDTAGKQMLAALKAAADRGVCVKVLVDGFSAWSHMENEASFYALAAAKNAEIRVYNKINVFMPWRANSRMHDKYLIADESVYILGGRNTFDYFLGDQDGYKNYDRDVLVYNSGGKESSLYQVSDYFSRIWDMGICSSWHDHTWNFRIPSVKRAEKELMQIYEEMKEKRTDWFEPADYRDKTVEVNRITLLSNPTELYAKEPEVFYGLTELMSQAKKEIWVHTPYVICNDWMYQSFQKICSGSAAVNMMTNSVTNNGNPFGAVDYALNKKKILDTGLQMWEYEGGVSYHGKSITIDDDIAIVGSFNMDMKSTYQDTELMLVVNSKELNAQLKGYLSSYQKEARRGVWDEEELNQLTEEESPWMLKAERCIIRTVDPWIRFLF